MACEIRYIEGGICAPSGFKASAACGGFKANAIKDDTALVVSEDICSAAAVYTKNKVKAAHIAVMKRHLVDGKAQAVEAFLSAEPDVFFVMVIEIRSDVGRIVILLIIELNRDRALGKMSFHTAEAQRCGTRFAVRLLPGDLSSDCM